MRNKSSHRQVRGKSKRLWRQFILLALIIMFAGTTILFIQNSHSKPVANVSNNESDTSGEPPLCLEGDTNCLQSSNNSPGTKQPTPTTNSSSSTSSNNCSYKTFPYATLQQDVTWLQIGQTMTLPGVNGTDGICDGKVTVVSKPVNAIKYIGIGTNLSPSTINALQPNITPQVSSSGNEGGLTESQAAQQCYDNIANGTGGNDSQQSYFTTCMHRYGY